MKQPPSFARSIVCLTALAGAALAQGADRFLAAGPRSARGLPSDRVYYDDTRGDGSVWARSATYKASFDASGATYIPFLGADAPRNYPVGFHLASVSIGGQPLAFDACVPAARAGDVIDFDRGSLVERYRMGPDSMEQQFVFESLPASGELVLRIEVGSELAGSEAADRIELSNELGAVRYGRATVLDRTGASAAAATTLAQGGIEIRAPASFLASARFPVTIDPIVSTFAIDNTTRDDFDPDVAYEVGTDRYLVVYEEVFSATDHDVVGRLLNSTGAFLLGGFIDPTGESWGRPRCASNRGIAGAGQFLVVASASTGLKCRTVEAQSLALGGATTVNSTPGSDVFPHHDVGGDYSGAAGTRYCVVFERSTFTGSASRIVLRMVDTNGAPSGTEVNLSNSTSVVDSNPSISKSNGNRAVLPAAAVNWNVVWQRQVSATNHDTFFARIHFDGFITTPITADDPLGHDTITPCVSPPLDSGRWMIVYQLIGTNRDLIGRLRNGTTLLGTVSLTDLEAATGSGTSTQNQISPSIDSDGQSFVVAYAESVALSLTNYNTFVSSFRPSGSTVVLSEGHRQLANSPSREDHPRVTTTRSGGGAQRRAMIVWDDDTTHGSQLSNIEGGLYDAGQFTTFCFPTVDAIACPCGNPPASVGRGCDNSSSTGGALLAPTGVASLASDTFVLNSFFEKPNAASTFLQGSAQSNAVFGMGVRCVGGSIKRLYLKTASLGQTSAPTGADPSVSARSTAMGDVIAPGSSRFYQVQYRDSTVLGGCPATATTNVTQGVMVFWIP